MSSPGDHFGLEGVELSDGRGATAATTTPVEATGWAAHLRLQFGAEWPGACTRLKRRRHTGPLLVQKPFYPEGSPCHVYLIHPPGGVVGGDHLELEVDVGEHAHALLTTPAAGKFYRCAGGSSARLRQAFGVAGLLEWLPQPNIYYPGCELELQTLIRLRGAGRFIGWEIGCLGLPAGARPFNAGWLRQSLEVWHGETPLLLERLHLDPDCLGPAWGLGGRVALGTWLAFPAEPELLGLARGALGSGDCADRTLACTLLNGVLCCRGFAASADRLREAFIALWSTLRPALAGRAAVPPRVWAT